MRWVVWVAAAGLFLAGCGQSQPEPAPSPAAELLVVPAGAGHRVVSTVDGSQVASLPPGALAPSVTAGGDLGETYVAGDAVYSVAPGRPFRVDRVADPPGPGPMQAVLVAAPQLTNFVGARTVLVVLAADGGLAGFQHGTRIWSRRVSAGATLRGLGAQVLVGAGGAWSLVQAVDGVLIAVAHDCPQGPLAVVGGRAVFACAGVIDAADRLPLEGTGGAVELHAVRSDEPTVAFADGRWYHLVAGPRILASGQGPGGAPPAEAPDGSALYWPVESAADSVATSRDGRFLYALGGGRLRVLALPSRAPVRQFPLDAPRIELSAGG